MIGNRLLEGVQLLGERCDLLGELFRHRLLGGELILNDLQLVDGLLLSYFKPLRRLEEFVRDVLARWGSAGRGRDQPGATKAPNHRQTNADENEGYDRWDYQASPTSARCGAVLVISLTRI
jgi:hypothetical protein